MEFGWHDAKRRSNLAKHGVDFADMYSAFLDTRKAIVEDNRVEYGEVRYNMLARMSGRLFHVTFTMRGEIVWLISARKANRREQLRYDER